MRLEAELPNFISNIYIWVTKLETSAMKRASKSQENFVTSIIFYVTSIKELSFITFVTTNILVNFGAHD
jgi:hypothetical protein